MPIYEYQCSSCDAIFEEWCKNFDDTTIQPCPTCGKEAHRLISRTSFALKGSGWYATEYGTLKGKGDAAPSSSSPAEASATPATASGTPAEASGTPASTPAAGAPAPSAAPASPSPSTPSPS